MARRRSRAKSQRRTYGPCEFHDLCGGEAAYKESGLCQSCHSSCRYWKNGKHPADLAMRRVRLSLFQARMTSVAEGRVRIGGTNKYEVQALRNKKRSKRRG